jgi:uncharacterized protein
LDYPRYDPASAVTPLSPAELDALDRLLQGLSDEGAMTLDGLDGYLTALCVGPPVLLQTLPTAEWLPLVWGGDGEGGMDEATPFASKKQRKATVVAVLRHLRHIAQQTAHEPAAWEPVFSIAEQGAQEFADARDWCTGFLQAVDLMPQPWQALWDDPELGPLLAPLLQLGGGLEDRPMPDSDAAGDVVLCDALSRGVPDAVLALRARCREQSRDASPEPGAS